jgi:hypothetical protein
VVELISQGVNDNRIADNTGHLLPGITTSIVERLWPILHSSLMLATWEHGTEAEVVLSAAYVDTGGHGVGHGFEDMTVGPVILQWPKHSLLGCRSIRELCWMSTLRRGDTRGMHP